jgi:molecular chaperone GrpE
MNEEAFKEEPTNGAEEATQTAETPVDFQAQLKEKDARYLYLYAEFENYKKRMAKERDDLRKYGSEKLARELLQVIDNLERALAHMPPTTDKTLVDGLHMTLNQFRAVLEKEGVLPVSALGQAFDPNVHEAVAQEASDKPEGTIVNEASKGYTFQGRLLRPARVVVSQGNGK